MLKFDEQKQIDSVRGALALRTQIEEIIDRVWSGGLTNLCWLGIGGTWASCMQAHCHMKERSALELFVTNAAEYCAAGDRRIGAGTLVIISSVTGTTAEIVEAVAKARQAGACILGFIDQPDVPLASMVDYCISYKANEQLKFFMAADRILWHEGVMPEYNAMYAQFDAALPEALAAVEKAADACGEEFARKHKDDALHYFVGAGSLYGATYSYAMCYPQSFSTVCWRLLTKTPRSRCLSERTPSAVWANGSPASSQKSAATIPSLTRGSICFPVSTMRIGPPCAIW